MWRVRPFSSGYFTDNPIRTIYSISAIKCVGSSRSKPIKYTFIFLGQPITLEYPYSSHVPEPSIYDEISRHAVCGFTSSTSQSSEQEPVDMNWSVSIKGATSGEFCEILLV